MAKGRELVKELRTLKASSMSASSWGTDKSAECECAWNTASISKCGTGTGGNKYRVGYNSGKPGRGVWR